MFLVISENAMDHVFVYEDPRIVEPSLTGKVVEDVSLERMDCSADWPYGFPTPEGSLVGQHPGDAKHFKVFESDRVRIEGRYLKTAGHPFGPYRSWSEYRRENGSEAV